MKALNLIFPPPVQAYFSRLFTPLKLPPSLASLAEQDKPSTFMGRIAEDLITVKQNLTKLFIEANTQPKTNLPNRRFFEAAVQEELERARTSNTKGGAIILADVDGLHNINRKEGFSSGDALLKKVADTFHRSINGLDPDRNDVACHLSGDDFAVLITDTPAEKADIIFKGIRSAFDRASDIGITIVSTDIRPDDTYPSLMARADQELRKIKNERPPIARL